LILIRAGPCDESYREEDGDNGKETKKRICWIRMMKGDEENAVIMVRRVRK
jgi:hypothetical protein